MRSVGRDIVSAEGAAIDAGRGHDLPVAPRSPVIETPQESEADEAVARERAKRLAIVLMGASSLAVVAVIAGLWFFIRSVM